MPPRQRIRRKKAKQPSYPRHRPTLSAAFRDSTVVETAFLVGLVLAAAIMLWIYQSLASHLEGGKGAGPSDSSLPRVVEPRLARQEASLRGSLPKRDNRRTASDKDNRREATAGGYARFSNIAQDLAALSPSEALEKLELDPFGTRAFDAQLLEHETNAGRVLTIEEIRQLFPCPEHDERITLPDARVEQKARDFREGKEGTVRLHMSTR